jgi:very-short-patch-repair endonuclease
VEQEKVARLGALAANRYGILSLTELLYVLTEAELRTWLRRGGLVRIAPRVYRIVGVPESWQGRLYAECLTAGPRALVSHRSAAALYGLNGFDPLAVAHLTIPRGGRPAKRASVRIHLSADYNLAQPTVRQGIPVTGPARLLLDLCASERNPAVRLRALDSARKLRLVTWDELWDCLAAHAERGRNGVADFRQLLAFRTGCRWAESDFEEAVRAALVSGGLPEPELQHWVSTPEGRFRIDAAYVDVKVGIEGKGKRDHFTEEAFERDPIRDNALAAEGWYLFTVTTHRLRHDADGFVRQVRRALRTRGALESVPSPRTNSRETASTFDTASRDFGGGGGLPAWLSQ